MRVLKRAEEQGEHLIVAGELRQNLRDESQMGNKGATRCTRERTNIIERATEKREGTKGPQRRRALHKDVCAMF